MYEFCSNCAQNMNGLFGKYHLKNDRWINWGGVLETLIPKTLDKKVFMGYNVAIIFILSNWWIFDEWNEFLCTNEILSVA